jgi:hypothetical protein
MPRAIELTIKVNRQELEPDGGIARTATNTSVKETFAELDYADALAGTLRFADALPECVT